MSAARLSIVQQYPKRQSQELIDKGHTDARHAMETPSGMIIDATEAIGVFAAHESNDGNPNLICIGVKGWAR